MDQRYFQPRPVRRLVVRWRSLPGWTLPVAGGTLVSVVVVLSYTGALWYFNDHGLPLLGD